MDDVRKLLIEKADEAGETLASLSKKAGKNHAYLQQFVKRGIPAKLPEDVRRVVSQVIRVPETALGGPSGGRQGMTAAGSARPPTAEHLIPLHSHILGGKTDAVIFDDIGVEMIPAPAQLIGVPNAYAAYVVGDSMEKRYRHGEVVYVNPKTPPRRGEDVAVQTYEDDGGQILLLIKRLVSGWPSSVLKLEQLNPHKTIDIPKARVKAVHRIILGGQR